MSENVLVYSTPTCPFCDKVKQYLESKGVDYKEVDLTQDMEARDEFLRKGHRGVPVTVVGEEEIVGFDTAKLDEALEKLQ